MTITIRSISKISNCGHCSLISPMNIGGIPLCIHDICLLLFRRITYFGHSIVRGGQIGISRVAVRALICVALCGFSFMTATAVRAQAISPPLEDRSSAAECLALAIAYEAGYESLEGQQAVAEVVLNRLRDPAFPKTVCGVVFAGSNRRTGCQFTFTCDGSLYRRRLPESVLQAARQVANEALSGQAPSRVPGATHYHAVYVHPYWAPSLTPVMTIGAHIFYQAPGKNSLGTPGALVNATSSLGPPSQVTSVRPAVQTFAPWGLPLPSADPRRQ